MRTGIYKIQNKLNGKCYIGMSRNIPRRLARHKSRLDSNSHTNRYLQNSVNKHGVENFSFEEVLLVKEVQDLPYMELKMIEHFDSYKNGYNLTLGGDMPPRNTVLSEKVVIQMRKFKQSHRDISYRKMEMIFGYHRNTISDAVRGSTFAHLNSVQEPVRFT